MTAKRHMGDVEKAAEQEVESMGRTNIMGADMEVVTPARLARARRAEGSIRSALDSPRTRLLEPDDAVLVGMS